MGDAGGRSSSAPPPPPAPWPPAAPPGPPPAPGPAGRGGTWARVRRRGVRRLVGAVVGLVAGFAVQQADVDWGGLAGSEQEATAETKGPVSTTAPASPVTTIPALPEKACAEDPPPAGQALTAFPAQPAPVPGGPGQHAYVYMNGIFSGHLDLAPGGGYDWDQTAASDAKAVAIVCAYGDQIIPTGITCDYVLEDTGERWQPTLHERATLLIAYEARTGRELGRSAPIGIAEHHICPRRTMYSDLGRVVVGTYDFDVVVEWTRQHLAGAQFTP